MASNKNYQHSLEASFNGATRYQVYREKTQLSTDHYVDKKSIVTDTHETRHSHIISSADTSSPAVSPTVISGNDTPDTTKCDSCALFDERENYDWELVDENIVQTALNFREELTSWHNDNKKLKEIIYTIIKGYLTLRLDHIIDTKQINDIRNFFNKAMQECDPIHIIKAYSLTQSFSNLLNKDMARIVLHDVHQGCSRFSCDTLYTTQDGTKSIASILFYHPKFITYQGTVYRGVRSKMEFAHIQVKKYIMTNTFLSTSKLFRVADMFSSYDRTEQKLLGDGKNGNISIGFKLIIKNINENRRAIDISGISEFESEEEVLLLPYSVFLVTKRETIKLQNKNEKRIEIELEECDQTQLSASLSFQ